MQEVHELVAELILAITPITVEDWDRPLFVTRIDHALIPRSGGWVSFLLLVWIILNITTSPFYFGRP